MFSANVFCAKRDFPPKNGPVPIQAVNANRTPRSPRRAKDEDDDLVVSEPKNRQLNWRLLPPSLTMAVSPRFPNFTAQGSRKMGTGSVAQLGVT